MDYYKENIKGIYSVLNSSEKGLSNSEAKARIEKYGYNKIESKKKISPFVILLQQFNDPMIWILIAAALISALLGEMVDFWVILAILIANAVIGFVQEYKAEKAIEALKKLASLKAVVLRNGEEQEVNAEELVPGDIVLLSAGEKIPADCRLISLNNLQTQEAALTGESLPVVKEITDYDKELQLGDRKNMVFSGTIITDGKATAIVVKTGMETEIGKIAKLIETAEKELTPLQKNLDKLGKFLTKLILGVCVVIFTVLFFRGETFLESLKVAASLAVAAIPEGLPAVVTVSLAIGVKRMIKKNSLVRKLPSVETLGSTTVICSDKTGTLTKNEMTVKKIFVDNTVIDVSGSGYEPEGDFSKHPTDLDLLLKIGVLNNDAKLEKTKKGYKIIGDPTEGPLLVSGEKAGFNHHNLKKDHPRIDEILFNSERKRMTTIQNINGKKFVYTKGAPDVVLQLCDKVIINGKLEKLTQKKRKNILKQNENFSKDALRVLGFAYKELSSKDTKKDYEKDLVFVGLQGMIDPAREEVKDSILKCKTAGIKVVMITGDYMGTAVAIANSLGIEGKAVQGQEIEKLDLDKEVEKIGVYARVNPEHKMRIVQALKKKGHIVAMTGDGVNDAPALKAADIGIAMGITGTDVSKEASDMILTDDNFSSIVNAVEEGRGIYSNIRKYFSFLLSGNIAEILIITFNVIFGLPLPLTATQILFINLVTDGLPAVALSADPFEPNALSRKPRKKDEPIYKGLNGYIIYYPIVVTIACLSIFAWYYFGQDNLLKAQTATFIAIGFAELFQALSCRSTIYPSLKVGLFKNKFLILAIISSLAIMLSLLYIPAIGNMLDIVALSGMEILVIMGLSSLGAVAIEISKMMKKVEG